MAEKRLTFTVEAETWDRLAEHAGEESVDDWVRDAIERKLAEEREPVEFVDDCSV